MSRLSIFNSKGGVAKTTTVLNLAAAAARDGQRVLLLDLDPQGHLTRTRGELPTAAADSLFGFFQDVRTLATLQVEWKGIGTLIPAHGQLIKVDTVFGKGPAILNKLRGGLDTLDAGRPDEKRLTLIDCCPYTGVLSLNALFAADRLLIPVSTDYLSLDAAFQITQALQILEPVMKRRLPRSYLLTRFDRRRKMSFDVREKLLERFGGEVCQTVISENVAVAEAPARKRDVFAHSPGSAGATDYQALYEELKASAFV
jgi:chromosome partitioning protein